MPHTKENLGRGDATLFLVDIYFGDVLAIRKDVFTDGRKQP
jgi:hypothetical protein